MADPASLAAALAGVPAIDEAAKLAFLRRPSSYADGTTTVEVKETHMSWVFLTRQRVYKLKKSVRYDFLDFSTVALRRRFCEEELRLNRRLAPDVYLGVLPLTVTPQGGLSLGGSGAAVDWLVEMRRLPESRMLDTVIRDGNLRPQDIAGVAGILDAFYAAAPRLAVSGQSCRRKLLQVVEGNRGELRRYCTPATGFLIDRICDAQARYIRECAARFEQRAQSGCILEGHGDLRPEHVFLGPPVQIIDCLEFERDFRIGDIVDDLASLALECDRLGASQVGRALLRMPSVRDAPADLIAFYKSHRATIRAKLAIWHLKDRPVAGAIAWRRRAAGYLELAEHGLATM
ncbi:hypothetical protein [Dongia sp. agr-C8]